MDANDTVLLDNETSKAESKPKTEDIPPEYGIELMLYILGGYNLAPSPLPSDLISLWSSTDFDKNQPCEYCGYKKSKICFPRVNVDFRSRKITFVSLKRACSRCLSVIDLKLLMNSITKSLNNKTEEFEETYNHFLTVNKLKNTDLNEIDPESSVIFQDLVSMAYSLYLIISNDSNLEDAVVPDLLNDKQSPTIRECDKIFLESGGGISGLLKNLTLNFKRRVPSKIKGIIEDSIVSNIDAISLNDMFELIVSLRMCKSFRPRLLPFFVKRINQEIYSCVNMDDYNLDLLLNLSLELIEYNLNKLLDNPTEFKEEVFSELTEDHYYSMMNNLIEFISNNISRLDKDRIFRLIQIFYLIHPNLGHISSREQFPCIIDFEILYDLTRLVLGLKLFIPLPQNQNSIVTIDSLYDCNLLVKILKLHLINYNSHQYSGNLLTRTSLSTGFGPVPRDKGNLINEFMDYINRIIYPTIIKNINKFTSNNVVELLEVIRRLGEPYPHDLIDGIGKIYVKHISQYNISNMLKLIEEFDLMGIRSEEILINTIITLPRKVTTLDSFKLVIKLMELFKNYESEYLDEMIRQQVYQIYHKINPKYLKVSPWSDI